MMNSIEHRTSIYLADLRFSKDSTNRVSELFRTFVAKNREECFLKLQLTMINKLTNGTSHFEQRVKTIFIPIVKENGLLLLL